MSVIIKTLFVENKKITIIIVIANFTEQILITKLFLGALDVIYFIPFSYSELDIIISILQGRHRGIKSFSQIHTASDSEFEPRFFNFHWEKGLP